MQQTFEDTEWDEENPIEPNEKVDEWLKLENIGDIIMGFYSDRGKETIYGKPVYYWHNVTFINAKTGKKTNYEKIGINNSGNLEFLLTEERLGEIYKLERIQDLPPKQKGYNPTHQFRLIPAKKKKQ